MRSLLNPVRRVRLVNEHDVVLSFPVLRIRMPCLDPSENKSVEP